MRITASHIISWVETHNKEAQTNLPRLIRRLCFIASDCRQLSFPAGDSSFVPGWDGVLVSAMGNAWAPAGSSYWEMGCDKNITSKANSDFEKRVTGTAEDARKTGTFVFVTPRRWGQKADWLKTQRARNLWGGVHAYDADDLEQWLEQSPGVALQFAEELGLSGPGICSPDRFWSNWANQCAPAITQQALLADRSSTHDSLKNKLQGITEESAGELLPLQADSTEEAAAFAVATVLESNLQNLTAIVLQPEGWRYVEANPQLRIAIAANTSAAQSPVQRTGLLVIVPSAKGNAPSRQQTNALSLERPSIYSFRDSLIAMNMEESDARRFAAATGRSWSILRRQRATNPAIAQPGWLDTADAPCLSLLCLLGSWNGSNACDQQIVERLAARPYADIEAQLCQLAGLDDAPVLRIDHIWKAKSPLELLNLCASRITQAMLDRFLAIAGEMFSTPDPQLELAENERWAAQVHGKVHPFSSLMSDSICDSLIKLAARGADFPALQMLGVEGRISRLVHDLLQNADATRWLSLHAQLPALAEAAPDEFLRAVETSLRRPDKPVGQLLAESLDTGSFGNCWHAGLLWALEVIAWSPRYLLRVALVLAALTRFPTRSNWGNTPANSLHGLFRYWLPMTAADADQRLQVLDRLIAQHEQPAFELLTTLLSAGPQMAMPAHQPRWRDDDAGTRKGVTNLEAQQMLVAAKQRALHLADGHAPRIAALLNDTLLRDPPELLEVLQLTQQFMESNDDVGREALCAALRHILHWHSNYSNETAEQQDAWLPAAKRAYQALAPVDLVTRFRWLFAAGAIELPEKTIDDSAQAWSQPIQDARLDALDQLHDAAGMAGIEQLIKACGEPCTLGLTLAKVPWSHEACPDWIIRIGNEFTPAQPASLCIAGLLQALPAEQSSGRTESILDKARQNSWPAEKQAAFMLLAPKTPESWRMLGELAPEVAAHYWKDIRIDYWWEDDTRLEVMQQLLAVQRPGAALRCCMYKPEQIPIDLLFGCLQMLAAGVDPEGHFPASWHMEKMISQLEAAESIDQDALIRLEFTLLPLLGHRGEHKAQALYQAITTDPALLSELVSLVYRAHSEQERRVLNEQQMATARRAAEVLRHCRQLPGACPDGSIDAERLTVYVEQALLLFAASDRQAAGERSLGKILAHAPADPDGAWPCLVVRNVLEHPEREDMRAGFRTGTRNKRGVTSRSLWDGGAQERDLATRFQQWATQFRFTHPLVASSLEDIASSYEHEARHHDLDAALNKESY